MKRVTTMVVLCGLVGLLNAAVVRGEDRSAERWGFRVGKYVPNCGMRVVFGNLAGKHTCLTGRYRKERTVSVYAKTVDDDLFQLLKVVDERMAQEPELKGFLLVFCETRLRDYTGLKLERLAEKHALKHVDIALANPRKEWRDLPLNARATAVFSDSRLVKLSTTYSKTISAEDLKRFRKDLATLDE